MGLRRNRIDWRGEEIGDQVLEHAREAIDEVTAKAAAVAVATAPRDRGVLADNIVSEPAVRRGRKVKGRFGVAKRAYWGLFQEYRKPFLYPAADEAFPEVADKLIARTR